MKRKILIIEDDPVINEGIAIILEKSGFDVQAFTNPLDLDPTAEPPVLYLIDRQLADIDGLDICRRLKALPVTREVPVIIMSATPEARELAFAAGANAFLEKPFSRSTLLTAIEELVPEHSVILK